jgi:hypothetical protein
MITGSDASVASKTGPGAENMKTGPDAVGTAENGSGSAIQENGNRRRRYRQKRVWKRKTRKQDQTPSVPPKMSPGAQNMKTGPDALSTNENGSRSAKHKNETRRRRYRQKESGSAKHKNGTRRGRYRRKWVRERKTLKRDPTPSVPQKTGSGAQNLKTGPDAIGTAEKESGTAKHENGTRRLRYCRKWVWERRT